MTVPADNVVVLPHATRVWSYAELSAALDTLADTSAIEPAHVWISILRLAGFRLGSQVGSIVAAARVYELAEELAEIGQ